MGKLSHADVVHLLMQLSIMLLLGRLLSEALRKFKQPAVIGEILAGILLGPTILGMIKPEWFHALYPVPSPTATVLTGFVQVAVIMLLFIAGLEVDLHIVWQQGKQALSTSFLGLIVPFSFGFIFPYFFPDFFGIADQHEKLTFALFMGTAMAITALPVIVRILMDLNLFKSKMGMLVVTSAMVDDLVGWLIFSVILGMIGKQGDSFSILNT
ncbi:MAG: cation:proton antiporter, partial [Cyclobacteriaceae bacterium]